MTKIEKATIEIKGKKLNFLKPRAVDLIEVEDKCIDMDGSLDFNRYASEMLKLVSPTLKLEDFIKSNTQDVIISTGDTVSLPEIGYENWQKEIKEIGGFSRVKLAKCALRASGVSGEITLDGFKYEDIDSLAMAFFKLYDSSELNAVIEEISNVCFS